MTDPMAIPDPPGQFEPDVRALHQALIGLVAATRTGIDPTDLEGALIGLHQAGLTWKQTLTRVTQMITLDETPYDLRAGTPAALTRKNIR